MWDAALEPIEQDCCLELLKEVDYGRVAIVTGEGRPEIFPVNFAVHGRTVVFITGSPVIGAWALSVTWRSRLTISTPPPTRAGTWWLPAKGPTSLRRGTRRRSSPAPAALSPGPAAERPVDIDN